MLKWKEFSFIIGGLKIIYVYESEEHLRSIRVGDSGRDFRRFELVYFFLFLFLLSVNLYSMVKPWVLTIFLHEYNTGLSSVKLRQKIHLKLINTFHKCVKDYNLYMEIFISAKSLLAFYGFIPSSIVNIQ